ncbi:MAG TPA: hypothetical protein VFP89_06215 [Propionibacteriaceae bacterium]|nr:hypothetical protein [Propionibacteriaceae bacterium]
MVSLSKRGKGPDLLKAMQVEAAVLIFLAVGQAGLAAGMITGNPELRPIHRINAYLIISVTIAILITAIVHFRRGGPRWPAAAAAVLVVAEALQSTLGRMAVTGAHIFIGVVFVASVAVLTSYLFRPGVSRGSLRS